MNNSRQISNKVNESNEYMLNLPRFLAKGLIYSFLFSSPSCQDLSLLSLSFSASRFSGKLSYSAYFSFTSGCPLYPCPRLCFAPFPWAKPAGHMHPCCICLARMNWPFDPHLRPTFHTYLRLITNFYFWISKAHYSLNTRWSSFFSLSNYDFSKIIFHRTTTTFKIHLWWWKHVW